MGVRIKWRYILVMEKDPDPLHPEVMPFIVQVPDTVALVSEPCNVRTVVFIVPVVFALWIVMPNEFALPLGMTAPVADAPVGKHAIPVVNCMLVAVTV